MHVRITRSLDTLFYDDLCELTSQHADFGPDLLRAVESALWGDIAAAYAYVEDERGLVAFLPLYYGVSINFMAPLPQLLQKGYQHLLRGLGGGAGYRVLVAGSLFSDKGWIPLRADAPERALELLLEAIESFCKRERVDILFLKDIHQSHPERARIKSLGYTEMHSLPTTRLNTDYANMDEYVATLSANGRSHARRNMKKAKQTFDITITDNFAEHIDELYGLFRNTYLRAEFQLDELRPAFFEMCSGMKAPSTELIILRHEQQAVGAYLMFRTRSEQLNKRVGFLRDHPQSGLIYNAMHYLCVERAIAHRVPTSWFGQTTYVPKLRLGAVIEEEFLYVKGMTFSVGLSLPIEARYMRKFAATKVLAGLEAP